MTAVGIVEMCSQLGIEPTSIELFLIGYKFDAQAGGRFTRTCVSLSLAAASYRRSHARVAVAASSRRA